MTDFLFLGSKNTTDGNGSHRIKRCLLLERKAMTNLDTVLKRRDVPLPTKVCIVSYGFSSSHVEMWELDQKQGWVPKNWCFWAVVLEKTLESPLDSKEIKPVDSKEKLWIFTLRIDAKAETLILWTPDANSQCIWKCKDPFPGSGKDPDTGKD